jgi:Ca2+-binding RTX toxin-like protein
MPSYPSAWTDQQIANQITREGLHWTQSSLTYSFNGLSTAGNTLDATYQLWINRAVQIVGEMIGINFNQVANSGNITFNGSINDGTYASTTWNVPSNNLISANIYFDRSWSSNQSPVLGYGSYGLTTIIHEFLHALGLEHPGNYNVTASYFPDALFLQDTARYSVMSYFDADWDGSGSSHWYKSAGVWHWEYPQTPMVYDLLALTNGGFNGLFAGYNPNPATRTGDTTYGYHATAGINQVFNFAANVSPVLTIYDAGGADTLDLSGDTVATARWLTYDAAGASTPTDIVRSSSVVDLRPGSYSSTHGMSNNIGIAFGTFIENAIGTGFNDSVIGNNVGNIISGGSGNDSIYAGAGGDFLLGDSGADTLYGGADADWFAFTSGGDSVLDFTSSDFAYFGGATSAAFSVSGANVIVNGVTLAGAVTGDATAVAQASTTLLTISSMAAIQSVMAGGLSALGAFGAYLVTTFDANSNDAWRMIDYSYTSANALDFTNILYDAGQPYYALNSDYDQAGTQNWSKIDTYLSTASLTDSYFLLFDAGQGFYGYNSDNDQAGNQTWTQVNSYFATASLLDTYFVVFDAGQGYYGYNSDYDQAGNQSWSVINTYMATASVIDTYYVAFDAGQPYFAINSDYDQAGSQTWSTVNTYYSAASVIDYYRVTFDAGQAYYSFDINYDQAANQTWSSIATYYSAPGIVDSETTYYDAGQPLHSSFVDYDQANAYAWNQHIVEFDTANHILNNYYI